MKFTSKIVCAYWVLGCFSIYLATKYPDVYNGYFFNLNYTGELNWYGVIAFYLVMLFEILIVLFGIIREKLNISFILLMIITVVWILINSKPSFNYIVHIFWLIGIDVFLFRRLLVKKRTTE